MEELAKQHFADGSRLYEKGKLSESVAKLKAALQIEPGWADARRLLAFVLCENGNFDGAIVEYKTILASEPNNAPTHYSLGRAYSMVKEWELALVQYKAATNIDPNYANAHLGLGLTLAMIAKKKKQQSLWGEAKQSFVRAITLEPQEVRSIAGLANAEWHLDNKLMALKMAERATEADQAYKYGWIYLLRFQILSGKLVDAWITVWKLRKVERFHS